MHNSEWIKVTDQTPPDKEVLVRDEYGNEGTAVATWFPFKVVKLAGDERKLWGWRGTPIPCEPYWDGGWMINATQGLGFTNIKGEIIEWKLK